MIDRILVPIDGSDEAARALEQASALAAAIDASLHVLSVVDVRDLETAPDAEPQTAATAELLQSTVDATETGQLPVTTAVETGVPDEVIREYADAHDIDLVVMGTHGRTGVRRFVLGSITEKVVRLSEIPVLVVRVSEAVAGPPYDDILLPTDGSSGADAAIEPAVALARAFGATVHVVSVVDTTPATIEGGWEVILEDLEAAAADAVEHVADRVREAGVDSVATDVAVGTPYSALRSYIGAADIDLVVMGTHGRSGIERYLLGSVTEKLLRTAEAPVLTVRYPSE